MKIIIGLVGKKLSGKDSVAKHLVDNYGAYQVKTSQILDDLLNVLGLSITRRNEIDAGMGMESKFGPEIIGQAVMRKVYSAQANIIVINGIRQSYQLDKAKNAGAKIIYLTAPVAMRYERAMKRNERMDDTQQTFEQFTKQDEEWIEVSTPALGAQADYKIENVETLEELFKATDAIINELIRQ